MPRSTTDDSSQGDPGESPADRVRHVVGQVTPSFLRRHYAAKFAISILFVIVVLGAVGGLSYGQIKGITEQDATEQLRSTSTAHADTVNEWVVSMRVQTRLISASTELQSADGAASARQHLMRSLQRSEEDVQQIWYVDTDSNTVIAGAAREVGTRQFQGAAVSEVGQPWRRPIGELSNYATVSSIVTMSNVTYEAEPGDRVMAFVSPVPDSDRAVVVVGNIENKRQTLQNSTAGQSTTILNSQGQAVLSTSGTGEANLTESSAFQRAATNGTVELVENDRAVRAFAPVTTTNWVAVTTGEKQDIYAVSRAAGTDVLLIIGAGLLSLTFVSAILGYQTIVPIRKLRERAQRMEDGDLDVDLSSSRVDEIGQLYHGFANMRDALAAQIEEAKEAVADAQAARNEAEEAHADAQAARERAERMNEQLEARADAYSDVMRDVAAGNLSRRMATDADSEAMREIAAEFNDMMAQIEETVADVRAFAEEVATASTEVATGASEIESASQNVSQRTQDIVRSATEQSENLDQVSSEMSNLSASIEEAASSSSEVADTAEAAVERGEEGRGAAETAIDEINRIETQTDRTVEQIETLEERMAEIGEIVDFISDIAEQTNILALNASIEAARAGEAGSGFAVVASEVKELAEETRDAAGQIEQVIEDVQGHTERTVTEMEETSQAVSRGVETVEDALSALEEIVARVEETNRGVQEISSATEDQADSTQAVVTRVDEVSDISKDVSAEAENAAAATEEQTASITEITQNATDLKERATMLEDSLAEFTLSTDSDATSEPETLSESDTVETDAPPTIEDGDDSDDEDGEETMETDDDMRAEEWESPVETDDTGVTTTAEQEED